MSERYLLHLRPVTTGSEKASKQGIEQLLKELETKNQDILEMGY